MPRTRPDWADRELHLPPLLGPLVSWRLALLFFMYASIALLPDLFDQQSWAGHFRWPVNERPQLTDLLTTWDANHYLYLAEQGYEAGTKSAAFYPLWPLLIRATTPLFGGSQLAAALILANGLGVVAALLFHGVARKLVSAAAADTALLLLLAFPGALFMAVPYSESLFLVLVLAFFRFLMDDRMLLAALPAVLLPICRPVGLFVALPLAVHVLQRMRRSGSYRPQLRDLLVGAPVVGFGLYLLLMQAMTGNAWEGFAAQARFYTQSSIWLIFDVRGFLGKLFTDVSLHGFETSGLDRLWFLLFLATLPATWKLDRTWFSYSLPMGLVPAMTVSLLSFTRYALVLFPAFVVAGVWLSQPKREKWRWPILGFLLSVQLLFLLRHINNRWAG
jgi:hypothetical protein